MKKLLLSLSMVCALTSFAQTETEKTPVITLNVEAGEGREITIATNAATTVSIDYGDGATDELTTTEAFDYSYTSGGQKATHTFAAASTVKIYGEGIAYISATSSVDGASITSADLSNASDLISVELDANKRLESLVLPNGDKLIKLSIANTSISSLDLSKHVNLEKLIANKTNLTEINLEKNVNLSYLMLSDCDWTSKKLDISANEALRYAYLLNMGLEEVTVGKMAAKPYISVNNNKLTSIDVSAADFDGGSLFAMNNNLSSIKYNGKIKAVNVTGNKFTFSTLPYEGITTLTYTSMQEMPIEANAEGVVDLSSEYSLKGFKSATEEKVTTYTWKNSEGTALVADEDYSEANGVFTFLKSQVGAYCEMKNDAFPALTLKTVAVSPTVKTPAITLDVEAGEGREITIGANAATTITVDFGDGTKQDYTTTGAYDSYTEGTYATATHTFADASTVRIYGEGLVYLDAYSRVDGASITAADFSNANDLTEISIYGNKRLTSLILPSSGENLTKLTANGDGFSSLDISSCVNLTTLNVQDTQLTDLDFSKNTKLASLYLSNCPWSSTSLDLSANEVLKSAYLINMGLEEVTVGKMAAKPYISVNNNKLTSIDVSAADFDGGSLFAMNNNLSSIKYNGKIKAVNVTGNKFTFSTLPYEDITTLTYTSMQEMPIEVNADGVVDLTSEYSLKGIKSTTEEKVTTYTWKNSEGTALVAGEDYSEANGVFTFLKSQENVYCEMKNGAFPALTLKTTAISVTAKETGVENIAVDAQNSVVGVYTVDGRYVGKSTDALTPGLYIVKTTNGAKKLRLGL